MLNIGWSWFVVPWWLADEVPEFPHLAQQALNASHTVANHATEMEVAASIAEVVATQGSNICWKTAIAQAAATAPSCVEYIDTVGQYVKMFGGGSSAQLIHFLAGFAKSYGVSLKLGQEFMVAITDLVLPSQQSNFIHLRTAIVGTQLTTDRVVDGIAQLIKKADINSFRAKQTQQTAELVESMLDTVWAELQELQKTGVATEKQAYKLYGLLGIRFVLYLTKKAKWGKDKTEYPSLEAILQVYKESKDRIINKVPGVLGSTAAIPVSSSSTDVAAANIGDSSNPLLIALQQRSSPLTVGNVYYNSKDYQDKLFKLIKLDISGAEFLEHIALKPTGHPSITCKLEELKKWVQHKGKLQELVDLSSSFPTVNHHIQQELNRCCAFTELCQLAGAHDPVDGGLIFTMNPTEVASGKAYKKGELKLICVTDLVSKITFSVGPTTKACKIAGGAGNMWVLPPQVPFMADLQNSKHAVVGPMWWVRLTTEADAVNMVECIIKGPTYSFQALTNCKAIKKHEKLLKAECAAPPKKKQKI
jgi:hypothetical protein